MEGLEELSSFVEDLPRHLCSDALRLRCEYKAEF